MATAKAVRKIRDSGQAAAAEPAVRINLGDLPTLSGYMMRRAQYSVFADFLKFFSDLSIRPVQYAVLTVIDANPGLKQAQISEALSIKRANLVAILDALEERGLARREPVATDRRSYALRLTDKGHAMVREMRERAQAHEARLSAIIGEDGREQLLKLLQGVIEAVGHATEDDES